MFSAVLCFVIVRRRVCNHLQRLHRQLSEPTLVPDKGEQSMEVDGLIGHVGAVNKITGDSSFFTSWRLKVLWDLSVCASSTMTLANLPAVPSASSIESIV